jgi:hypothetical protein
MFEPWIVGGVDETVSSDDNDRAARDGAGRLATMPLSVGRYLRSLTPEDSRELGQCCFNARSNRSESLSVAAGKCFRRRILALAGC